MISINFMPQAVYEPAPRLRTTVLTAKPCCFPIASIMFELTEDEEVSVGWVAVQPEPHGLRDRGD